MQLGKLRFSGHGIHFFFFFFMTKRDLTIFHINHNATVVWPSFVQYRVE